MALVAALPQTAERLGLEPALRVEAVTGYESFLALEPAWNQLVDRAGIDHPFLEHVWVRTWWECFGCGSTLHILIVNAGDEPIAIVPLIFTQVRMWGIPVRRLGFFYNAHVPRSGLIIGRRNPEAYRAIWSYLASHRSWDLLQFCQLPEGSDTLAEISELATRDSYPVGVWKSCESPYVPLQGTWAEYFGGLAAKHRANLRNRFKRLRALGPVELEAITSERCLTDALGDGLGLEAAAWKRDAGTAISCDPSVAKFYTSLAERAERHGWLRLHFLDVDAKRIAFDYSLCYKNRLYLLKLGYDPAYAQYSPSNLLTQLALQASFERGEVEYDFLGDNLDWKKCWSREARPHYWLYVFSNTLKGRFLRELKFKWIPSLKRFAMPTGRWSS
jgi:CelD/BcsL family acetyltransferase involved in cellulose biosynthesis